MRGEVLEQLDYYDEEAQYSNPSPDLERLVDDPQAQIMPGLASGGGGEEEGEQQQQQEGGVGGNGGAGAAAAREQEEEDMIFGEDIELPLDIGEQGRFYIAGWLAKKLRHKFPNLECLGGAPMGYPTDHVPATYGPIPEWIAMQSRGE